MPDRYITETGVELAKVGTWPTYKGDGTLTPQDLQDAVAAFSDPEVRDALHGDPVGWLGHVDSVEAAEIRQSEPAVGRITNVRVSDDGLTLLGDLVNVPERVAKHYPRRSVEMKPNVTTTAGRTYRRVLTGLAFLGRKRPAIRGLRDLNAWLDAGDRQEPVLAAEGEPILMALAEDGPTDPDHQAGALPVAQPAATVEPVTDTATPSNTEQERNVPQSTETQPDETVATESTAVETTTTDTTATTATAEDGTTKPAAIVDTTDGPKLVEVTQANWDQIQAKLAELEAKEKARDAATRLTQRDQLIAAAEGKGKLAPADKDETIAFADKHGNDALQALLDRLPENKVPLGEIGTNATDDTSAFAEGGASDWSHLTHDQAVQLGYIKD